MEKISDEEKIMVDRVLLKIANYIEKRTLSDYTTLTPEATAGFNLACEFLAHELKKMRELTVWKKDDGYSAGYNLPKEQV